MAQAERIRSSEIDAPEKKPYRYVQEISSEYVCGRGQDQPVTSHLSVPGTSVNRGISNT